MDRSTLPLLLASDRSIDADETEPLDRLRMQKGVFLLEQRGPAEWRTAYHYSPYNWGPYSSDLSSDIEYLSAEGLLQTERGVGRYPAYKTTATGERWLDSHLVDFPQTYGEFVKNTRKFVTARSFSKLLKDVYAAYPAYAVRSRFTG